MEKNVKILKGLFSGKIGTLYESFNYHGNKIYVVKFPQRGGTSGHIYYTYTTVKDLEYEVTTEKENIQEIKGM